MNTHNNRNWLRRTILARRHRTRSWMLGSVVLLVALGVVFIMVRGPKSVSAFWTPGGMPLSNEYTGNADIFPADSSTVSYAIISGHGVSPVSQYVVHSANRTVKVSYNYIDLRIADPGSEKNSGAASHSNDCSVYDVSGNDSYSTPSGWKNGRINAQFRVIGKGGSVINGQWSDIELYNAGNGSGDICKDQTFTVSLPYYDEAVGMYRGYFETELGWQHRYQTGSGKNRKNAVNPNTGYSLTNSKDDIGYYGVRLKHILSLEDQDPNPNTKGPYITYGKPTSATDTVGPMTTFTIRNHGTKNAYLPFGLTCAEARQTKSILLYDVDNDIAGVDVWYAVEKYTGSSWTRVDISGSTPAATYDYSRDIYTPQKKVSSQYVFIRVTMDPNTRYRLVMGGYSSGDAGSYNFYKIQMPSEGIYGGPVSCPGYDLTPRVINTSSSVAADAAARFDNTITNVNDSNTGTATGVQWRAYGFVTHGGTVPGNISPNERDNLDGICNGLDDCSEIGSGSDASVARGQTLSLDQTSKGAMGLHYGDRVCSFLAISPYHRPLSDSPRNWRISETRCIVVTKTPRLQVWGNDVRVGSGFTAATTTTSSTINTNRGSWGEYGVLAPRAITSFGSGAAFSGIDLTFANTPSAGSYTTSASVLGTIPDVRAYLVRAGSAEYRAKTGVTINDSGSSDVVVNSYVANTVYVTTGTVTISGDITNPSTGANLTQMVIIARNVVVDPNVKQIDAWLIATGVINTCSASGDPTVANCGAEQLVINGPVMASQLLLRRTSGDDADQNSPAETINLRGDAYIWTHKLSSLTGTVRTVYTRELAPRY